MRAYPAAAARSTWQTLVAARFLRFVPQDRDGFEFMLDPVTGDVRLNPKSPLLPLPTETPGDGAVAGRAATYTPAARAVALSDRPAADARAADVSASRSFHDDTDSRPS